MGFVKHWNSNDWAMAAGVVAAPFTAGASLVATAWGVYDKVFEEPQREFQAAQEQAAAQAQQEWRESEIQRKTSLLAAQNTMTARQAMARNISAALKGMYSPKISNTSPTPQTLGGDSQTLG